MKSLRHSSARQQGVSMIEVLIAILSLGDWSV